jgi:tetratricopeptide (TPR) repeat protein
MSSSEFFEGGSSASAAGKPSVAKPGDPSQLDFEIDFFQAILSIEPEYVDVLRCQGELLTRKGLHQRAVEVDRRLARLQPDDCVVHYNFACSLAQGNHSREAIDELRKAFERGYDDFSYLETDSDLDNIREKPEFKALLKEFWLDE